MYTVSLSCKRDSFEIVCLISVPCIFNTDFVLETNFFYFMSCVVFIVFASMLHSDIWGAPLVGSSLCSFKYEVNEMHN